MKRTLTLLILMLFTISLSLSSCSTPPTQTSQPSATLKVVATTTLVGDVVQQVGGDLIDLTTLLTPGIDPHTFQPTPQDVASLTAAQVIFANGAGLEEFLESLADSAGVADRVVHLDEGIELISSHAEEHEGEHHHEEGEDHHHHAGGDPHLWTDPNNVILWTQTIASKLSALDPAHASVYAKNAEQYTRQLHELDGWIRQQVAEIPEDQRVIVTDHLLFAYFAERYGFHQAGAIIPGYSTAAEPSAQELAALEDAIRQLGVKAILVGNTVNPSLAQRVAEDTGTRLVFIYTGSLSAPGGEADSYIQYIRYNVSAIVEALK